MCGSVFVWGFSPPPLQAAGQRQGAESVQGVGVHGVEGLGRAFVHRQQTVVADHGRHPGLRPDEVAEIGERAAGRRRGPGRMQIGAGRLLGQKLLRAHEAVAVARPAAGEVEALDHAVAVQEVALAVAVALEQARPVPEEPTLEARRQRPFDARPVVVLHGQGAGQRGPP